jgi:hypothetical protein
VIGDFVDYVHQAAGQQPFQSDGGGLVKSIVDARFINEKNNTEAVKRGLDKSDGVVRAVERMLEERLVDKVYAELTKDATVSDEMVQMLCGDDPMKRQLLLAGGGFTTIYAPDGQLMHEPLPEGQEGIVYADLDLGMIALAKAAADPAGHYARPDVTRLLLDRTPGDRVVLRQRQAIEIARSGDDEPAVDRAAAPAELPPARRAA